MNEDQATCGKGVAAHATMPAVLAGLMAAVAENLEVHMKALDLSDDAARRSTTLTGSSSSAIARQKLACDGCRS